MSQYAVEAAMGRLICDDAFRARFRADPQGAVREAGFDLTAYELAGLRAVNLSALERLAAMLDDRIRRASEVVPVRD